MMSTAAMNTGALSALADVAQCGVAAPGNDTLYHTLLDRLPQQVLLKDCDSRFVFVNAAFARDFGKHPRDFVGKTDFDLFPKELAQKYYADDQRIMAIGEAATFEETNVTEGRTRYVEVTKAPLFDKDEKVIGLVCIFSDVTDRRMAQLELARERNLLRTLLDHVPDRIYFKDTESRFVWGSPSLLAKLGLASESELVGKTDFDFYPEEQAREFQRDEQNVIRTREPMLNKIERRTIGGQERWSVVSKVPVLDRDGCIAGVIGISRDITDVKLAEQEAQRSRAFLDSVIENLPIMVFIKRAEDLRITLWNRASEEVTGQPAKDVIGRNDYDLFPPEEAEFFVARDREVIEASMMLETPEEVIHTPHKGVRVLRTRKIPICDEKGVPQFLVGISEDVTERKRAEDKLKDFATQLENNNRELQDFAYVASHDLQEPLRKVRAFGDRLRIKHGAVIGEEGRDYLNRMLNAAQRMQTLIEDLLAFSRVTTRAQPFVPVDLNEIAREVVSDLEVRIEQAKGSVEIGPLPVLDADPTQMRQLLQNLIGNALKFHKPGETPLVKVFAEADAQPKRANGKIPMCRLHVQDNGIGFDEKYLDRIFTVFQRLHGRGEYEGTGVGLAICRKIALRHHGDITARSKPGEGATFIVALPLQQPKTTEKPT